MTPFTLRRVEKLRLKNLRKCFNKSFSDLFSNKFGAPHSSHHDSFVSRVIPHDVNVLLGGKCSKTLFDQSFNYGTLNFSRFTNLTLFC